MACSQLTHVKSKNTERLNDNKAAADICHYQSNKSQKKAYYQSWRIILHNDRKINYLIILNVPALNVRISKWGEA